MNNNNKKKKAHQSAPSKTGILIKLKNCLEKNKVGELLVTHGLITAQDLKNALKLQKEQNMPLGYILVENNHLSRFQLYKTLGRQHLLRGTAGLLLCMMSFSFLGSKRAHADYIKDVPAKISISASSHFTAAAAYPPLLGSEEKKSGNLKPFTKWTEMFDRFDQELKTASAQSEINKWQKNLRKFQNLPLKTMADKVNDFVNESRYITDDKNWGKSDYWATPVQFLKRGGDCEDFAIAKYTALRTLGVPENRLRIAIVHDNLKNIPHAVLIVYAEQGAYILDNQNDQLINAERYQRYRPIFSINRQAWWLHTAPKETILASAE
ncbi:MAG: transglutaminase-like cysteine peptidase [Alphaproteobacteria bacterium]